MEENRRETVIVRAYSPDAHPILVLERESGELCAVYHETSYDPDRAKPVGEEWLRDNALGRHSFREVDPPRSLESGTLLDYARHELGV